MYDLEPDKLSLADKESLFLETLKGYLAKDQNLVTNLANMSAVIHAFYPELNWVGFYLYDDKGLYLGPFQGMPACTSIHIGKGVCGTSAKNVLPLLVPDTSKFPGHIVCDVASKSELVIPVVHNSRLVGVLDLDSPELDHFQKTDLVLFTKAVNLLVDIL